MSFSPSPSKSRRPQILANCSPNLLKQMQQDTCYICKQVGHWSWFCPYKSPTKPVSPEPKPKPKPDSPVSSDAIQCRCGHGACEVKTSRSGRNFYACPIKRGIKCKDFVKWCDDPIDERDLQPPPFKYPVCACEAGVCRRVMGTESHDAFKYYFTCPFRQGHGSCGYRVSVDELLNSNSRNTVPIQQDELLNNNNRNTVPTRQSRQRSLHDFFEGCQNDKVDDELGKEDGLQVQIKRIRITDCSESPEISEKEDAGAALNRASLKRVDDGDREFTNSVSWEKIEAQAFLFLSSLSATSRIRWRQIMFQRRIFSGVSFEIDRCMENSLTMEEDNRLFEEQKMRFAQLQDDHAKAEALLEALNRQRQLLCEQVSNLKAMLNEKKKQLEFCELETLKIETHLGDLKRKILETDLTLKERAEQTEVARKLSEERQAKEIAAKEMLEKAKLELEN
ncbi:uncharacterized protein LOC109789642 isoform X2 [Cajanus cajan]|uniref:uncharacterized protein LOC109789642 isoform X2 n=1 Tax=Cajanus cajan TaxID=3821 RepID=UPI00098DC909|nr:uncharacterized protein LOC109789642 isoform X2 [Cajanus cajan]